MKEKVRLKCDGSSNPHSSAISVMLMLVVRNICAAHSRRRPISHFPGVVP